MPTITKDTLWKGIIEDLFEGFCKYFLPEWAENEADFSQKPIFLDKELDELYPEVTTHKSYADKLVKVFNRKGEPHWLLLHIEVQGYSDPNFAERMFTYFYRIRDRHGKFLMALAIFTDRRKKFEPSQYHYHYHGTKLVYQFNTFKLLHKSDSELQVPGNPFSVVMLAAKKALAKKNLSDQAQLVWKRELVSTLKSANFSLEKIRIVLHFISYAYTRILRKVSRKSISKK